MGKYDYLCAINRYSNNGSSEVVASRQGYVCNSEDRSHYDSLYDFSTPMRAKNYDRTVPTFVTYNVTVDDSTLHEVYRDEIESAIKRILADATEEQIQIVMTKVLENITDEMTTSIEDKVNEVFASLGVISEEDIEEITSQN